MLGRDTPSDAVSFAVDFVFLTNTTYLDLIRMELLKLAKQLCDFPYPKSTLKRRLERRSKDGDCLSVKLARDCYCLKLASNRVYSSDLGLKVEHLISNYCQ
jgi:hypothetical protein